MKNIFLSLFLAFFTLSCTTETERQPEKIANNCEQSTVINAQEFANTNSAQGVFQNLQINGNCLKIKYASSGCDGSTWTVKLVSDGATDYSTYPVTKKVKFVLTNQELCLAVFQKERSFDVSGLQVSGQNSVQIKVENYSQPITYQY